MFQNGNNWQQSQRNKTKKYKNKRSSISNHKSSEHSKHSKTHKQRSHCKLSKIKHMNIISDYVGPERLTKHVGFFTKGKISDSISRIEKIMPKDVKARVKQDLKEVLKLTSVSKTKKCKKKHSCSHHSYSSKQSKVQSVQSSFCTPQYLQHKTGFASNSWKDKLQQSVGLSAVNSVLDSVHKPVCNSSPIQKPQLLTRKVLLTSIYPLIKKTNCLLFPNSSNRIKLKEKLKLLKNQSGCNGYSSENTSCCSSIQQNSQISQSVSMTNNSVASLSSLTNSKSQSTIKEDFNLNPVFIGESIVQNDINNIFPTVNDFLHNGDLVRDIDFMNIPEEKCNSEINSVTAPSSIGNSVLLTHNSPTSSNDSPAWKLQLSPVKFEPELGSSPTLYFRHKMF